MTETYNPGASLLGMAGIEFGRTPSTAKGKSSCRSSSASPQTILIPPAKQQLCRQPTQIGPPLSVEEQNSVAGNETIAPSCATGVFTMRS
jgi:hypothetical protein